MTTIPRAVLYARYSTDRQDARSIDDQMRRCRQFCAQRGFEVVREFSDSAVSGAHVHRDALRSLLDLARGVRGAPPFSVVVVDDLSRLSRDMGDTWQLVFRDLAGCGVHVADATSGQSSDSLGARVTFGALALVNDTFLQLIRTETHRGLEGRAISGFSTGGRCYGYHSVVEPAPPDPAHPRRLLQVRDDQAAIVREVFDRFVAGEARSAIARSLNDRGVPSPVTGKGWGRGAITWMLRNERYKGILRWNVHQGGRTSGQAGWKRKRRPETQHVVRHDPALVIVDQNTWDAAARRLQEGKASGFGRPVGTGRHVYLVSGLLRCAACGAPMSVVSRKRNASSEVSRFGCRRHRALGKASCRASRTVATRQATEAVLDRLRHLATSEGSAAALSLLPTSDAPPAPTLDGVDVVEARVANLTDALARLGWSDAVAARLKVEEALLRQLRSASTKQGAPDLPITAAAFMAYVNALVMALEENSTRGRESLSRFASKIVVSTTPDAVLLTGAFDVAALAEGCRRWAGKSGHAFSCSP